MCKFKKPSIPEGATEDELREFMFNSLYSLDLNDKLEKRDNDKLSYLSWANAWAEFKAAYPSATYRIIKNPATNLPYFSDPNIGIMVYTEVTVGGLTYEMWLPVMNGANKAMKETPYTYQVWDSYQKKHVEKVVQAATMFDINKSIMRCLVKNLAMFGLGLYVYAGEDIPEKPADEQPTNETAPKARKVKTITDRYSGIKQALSSCPDQNSLMLLYQQHKNEVDGNNEVKALFTERKLQLQKAA
ncbi:DUF1071 domain-containing protein [Phocaeicola vulgatus]|uniref:Sak single strand annealing protein n=1 Tax=Phocaeicola vulgatus TaxID=821 RepID=UPI003DA6395A